MDKYLFERAANIFVDAAAEAPEDQDAFIEKACEGDDALLHEVRALLSASDSADDYFAGLADRLGLAAQTREDPPAKPVIGETGLVVGAYTLTEPIGSGGTGTVWRAERTDGQFQGDVAIKLVNPAIAIGAAASRIAAEAQHLAKLSHPNIARLLDAGIDSGDRRYLVLEYVDGTPVTTYCNDKRLDVSERVRLFLDVVHAVSHAHARLIVHRDIKPSNVLVDRNGSVKLLDFGIAKLLRSGGDAGDTVSTIELGTALTPEYAAPEQLLGQPVTTATDVYALGLMLYELLAGRGPRSERTVGSYAELVEMATQDPPKASTLAAPEHDGIGHETLRRRLRGDLDSILQKALAPNPEDRYVSANGFAADLMRYLSGEAVTAMPPTVAYRSRKFVSRHRGGVASALLTTIALLAALTIATLQMFEARTQRDAALYQQQRVQASNEFYSLLLEEMGTNKQPLTAIELLDRGAELLGRQFDVEQPHIGRIHYDLSRHYGTLRERNRQLELLGLAERAARANDDKDLLGAALCTTAWQHRVGDIEHSRQLTDEGKRALAALPSPSISGRVACLRMDAHFAEANGSREQAIDILLKARRELLESASAPAHQWGITLNDLSRLFYVEGRYEEALTVNAEILELLQSSGRGNTLGYLQMLSNRAATLGATGEVLADYALKKSVLDRLDDTSLTDNRARIQYETTFAMTMIRLSRYDEGIELLQSVRKRALEHGSNVALTMNDMYLANGYVGAERFEEAEQSLQAVEGVFAQNPTRFEFQLRSIEILRATIERKTNRVDAARERIEPLLAQYDYPPVSVQSSTMAALLSTMAKIELDARNYERSETLSTDLLSIREAFARQPDSSAAVGGALVIRAKARHGLGNVDGAIADLRRAIPSLENGLGEENTETKEARSLLSSWQE
ncbi:MAG: protein kinase [Pseudomonadota bacterium]